MNSAIVTKNSLRVCSFVAIPALPMNLLAELLGHHQAVGLVYLGLPFARR